MKVSRFWGIMCYFSLIGLSTLPGCGEGGEGRASIDGTATFEGQPIESGYINFLPDQSDGPTVGSPITNGKFQITGVVPGKKRVQIVAAAQVRRFETPAPLPKEETSKPTIPPNAVGNNQIVVITAGKQSLDFGLKKP